MRYVKGLIKKNSGFTLVELVVVIAIIGVIAVALSPVYLKYVEKSRKATDENALNELAHATEVAYVNEGKKVEQAEGELGIKIFIKNDGQAVYGPVSSELALGVKNIIPEKSYIYKSKHYRGSQVWIKVDEKTGNAYVGDMKPNTSVTASQLGFSGLIGIGVDEFLKTLDQDEMEILNQILFESDNLIKDLETTKRTTEKIKKIGNAIKEYGDRYLDTSK